MKYFTNEIKSFRKADEKTIRIENEELHIRLFDNEEERATFINLTKEEAIELMEFLEKNYKVD